MPAARPGSRGLVFVSHTSRRRTKEELGPDEYRAQGRRKEYLGRVLTELEQQLPEAGFQIWWDRRDLQPGQPVDASIHSALNRCRAAVILIDADALNPGYMRREVNILAFRGAEQSVFVLPVLLHVDAEQVRDSQLGHDTGIDVQLALRTSNKRNSAAARQTAEQITEQLLKRSAQWQRDIRSPVNRWIDDVAVFLTGASQAALREAAARLDLDLVAWERSTEGERRWEIAAAMWSADGQAVYEVLEGVADHLSDAQRQKIVKWVLPQWVDLRAARTVREVAGGTAGSYRAVSLATRAYRLGEHVVRRSTAGNRTTRVVRLTDVHGEGTIQELVGQSEATLRRELNFPKEAPADEVASVLRSSPDRGVYAILRADTVNPATSAAVVRELQHRFPGITVVVLNQSGTPGGGSSMISPVFEDFPPERERQVRKFVSDLSDLSGARKIEVDSDE
ncbi:toll/interleukin-1 receptor domain-containing protein [Streptomyces sp. NPDC006012]|uniref:toll/interleukin-1 receptor domain-containing protein n=1 Tax=Streptomyces sp. NPDC006012 TaxID=3364739 RepID=UPI0036AB8C0D